MGVFDGVHRGHQLILRATVDKAKRINGTSVALTFWPHPQKQESLCSIEHRLRLIGSTGVDVCIVLNFSPSFARISARDFMKNILAAKIGSRYIYIGKDFRFGRNASGDYGLLKKYSHNLGFKVYGLRILRMHGAALSSTSIRRLIRNNELEKASRMLGRRVSILGSVIRGGELARRWGVPTANVKAHHEVIPPDGIYAAYVLLGERKYKGICYIGSKPTFKPESKSRHIEVNIFNFSRDIYSQQLEVQFVRKIRDDRKFASAGALIKQIRKDISCAKKTLP